MRTGEAGQRIGSLVQIAMPTLPLAFQRAILAEILAEDALVLMAQGLPVNPVLLPLCHAAATSQGSALVLLLGTTQEEVLLLNTQLDACCSQASGPRDWIRVMNNETPVATRCALAARGRACAHLSRAHPTRRTQRYLAGGIISITSRILIVDILTNRVPAQLVTGILVNHAHSYVCTAGAISCERTNVHRRPLLTVSASSPPSVTELSIESFILRLYREANKVARLNLAPVCVHQHC